MPLNSLTLSRNEVDQTRPATVARRDPYGRIQIGGPIGAGDIQNAMAADKQIQMGAELAQDIMPVVETVRSAQRLPQQWQAYKDAENPLQQALRAADMALEGGAMVADVIPYVKAAGATAATLVPLMMRRNDELDAMAKFGIRQRGIIGYHGSPHKFDKFDHSMMGSGEGAQAYGWGTYLAEKPGVAASYQSSNIQGGFGTTATSHYYASKFKGAPIDDMPYAEAQGLNVLAEAVDDYRPNRDFAEVAGEILDDIDAQKVEGILSADEAQRAKRVISGAKPDDFKTTREIMGNLYEVDLPDEQIAKMLDWDAPLSEQPENVKQLLAEYSSRFPEKDKISTGHSLYNHLSSQMEGGQEAASDLLRSRGIPGIKYWDGGSRQSGSGTRNFVVFDEDLMTIMKRNDEAIK